MIEVWYANHVERLSERLIENIATTDEDPRVRLFAMPTIVVPTPALETYLRYQIAREAGVATGLVVHTIDSFVESLRPRRSSSTRLLDREQLRIFFLDLLLHQGGTISLPGPVQRYLDAAGDNLDARDLRGFQLATRLADLSRQYSDLRPDLLQAWGDQPVSIELERMEEPSAWQRELWARLVGPKGLLDRAWTEHGMRWVLPYELFGIFRVEGGAAPPAEVHFFGFSYAWPGIQELLGFLDAHSRVQIYALTPTAPFRRDLVPTRSGKKGNGKSGRELITEDDPNLPQIVKQWGRPERDFFGILGQMGPSKMRSGLVLERSSTALAQLQNELLTQQVQAEELAVPDDSLMFLACPGIRREMEIVANEIWRLISEDDRQGVPSNQRLRFRDIAVGFADVENLAIYQAHLRAAFEELHGIPYAMTDLPLSGECRIIEAVLSLFGLPFGRFSRPEMLKILTHPALQARFPEADTTRWSDWCEALAIVHGGDQDDHADTYIDRDLFHWEQGLRRLVLGAFMNGPGGGDPRVFSDGASEYLPHDEPAEALADSARLLVLVRSLIADARFLRHAQLSYLDWSTVLSRMVTSYFTADSIPEQRALSLCLGAIHHLRTFHDPSRAVRYRVVYENLREALGGLTGSRGLYLAEGVAVSPLAALRGIPFRVIFVCGLGEGRFPSSQGPDPLEVGGERRLGELSPRERDKFLFFETLASTRDRLYLSYVARDSQTGERLEPSPLVHELIGHLDQGRTIDPARIWMNEHPLRRYADNYFSGGRARPTFLNVARAARSELRARRLRESLLSHSGKNTRIPIERLRHLDTKLVHWLGLCPVESSTNRADSPERLALSLRDIRRFLECPLQGWARLMLRLREDEDEDLAAREDEHFFTQPLSATVLLREVFFDLLNHRIDRADANLLETLYTSRAQILERQGLSPVGIFRDVERRRHLDCLAGWQASALKRGLADRGPFEVYRLGRAGENEHVAKLESPIILDVPSPGDPTGSKTLRVEIHGRTEIVSRRWPGSLSLITRDSVAEKDFLGGFLDAVVMALLPSNPKPEPYHAHVIPTPDPVNPFNTQRTFRPITEAMARRFLTDVVTDLIGGSHAYLLPCEAVFASFRGEPIAVSIERMKESDSEACSSRWGPVPNFSLYDPPDEEEAHRFIERRFGLFRDSGEAHS